MIEENTITLGNTAQHFNTITIDVSKFLTTEDDIIIVNLNKEENENMILEELNALISQEEKHLTGDNINRIQELLNKLPFEETRIELTYRKDEIVKSLMVQKEVQDIENEISNENSIIEVKDIFSLINRYKKINKMNRNLNQIEDELVRLHNRKFQQLLNKENYNLNGIDDNIKRYEEIKIQIEELEKDIRFVSNNSLMNSIIDEIDVLKNKKGNIEDKLMKLLSCDRSSLDLVIRSQRLINRINNSNSLEDIDIALIENNFIDYINLGQKKRRKALTIFMENSNKSYTKIEEVSKDLNNIVSELKKQLGLTDTIKL